MSSLLRHQETLTKNVIRFLFCPLLILISGYASMCGHVNTNRSENQVLLNFSAE